MFPNDAEAFQFIDRYFQYDADRFPRLLET